MIDEDDARWLRERFDGVVSALSEAMTTPDNHEPLDRATTNWTPISTLSADRAPGRARRRT